MSLVYYAPDPTLDNTMPRPTRTFDVPLFIRDLGGVSATRRKLEVMGEGAPPTDAQMRKWVQRGAIPADWLVILLEQSRADGRNLDLVRYLR